MSKLPDSLYEAAEQYGKDMRMYENDALSRAEFEQATEALERAIAAHVASERAAAVAEERSRCADAIEKAKRDAERSAAGWQYERDNGMGMGQ